MTNRKFHAFEKARKKILKWMLPKEAEAILNALISGKTVQVEHGRCPTHRYTIYNSYDKFLRLTDAGFMHKKVSYGDGKGHGWKLIKDSEAIRLLYNGLGKYKIIAG